MSTLPKHGIISEVGVKTGSHALDMLHICNPKKMYLIDSWDENDEYFKKEHGVPTEESLISKKDEWHGHYTKTVERFKDYSNVEIIKKKSYDAHFVFADNYFNVIYLDAGHRKEYLSIDMQCWYPKLKIGGVLCGHDFIVKNGCDFKTPKNVIDYAHNDVPEAVIEFILSLDFKIDLNIYVESSGDKRDHYEWMIEKR